MYKGDIILLCRWKQGTLEKLQKLIHTTVRREIPNHGVFGPWDSFESFNKPSPALSLTMYVDLLATECRATLLS